MPQGDFSAVLLAAARLIAEAPTLSDVMSRLAGVLRDQIPFDRLHVLRLDRAESVVLYVVRASGEIEVTGHRIASAGPAAHMPLDTSVRSRMICTVRHGARVHGALWCTSGEADAFSDTHQALIEGVADLLALALQHEALRTTESLRRDRLESLERLLHTMAESLDIRHVFPEVSEVVRGGLPHDMLAVTSWAEDGRSFRVYALTGV
jgi:GAF domain-containing protein